MFRILIPFILCAQGVAQAQVFTGQVFQLAETYEESTCATDPGCDCCSGDLIFLTPTQFVLISRCIFNDTYYTGTYAAKANGLKLTFKGTVVDEVTDEETMKVENKKRITRTKSIEYAISHCGVAIKLESTTDGDYKYGSHVSKKREEEILKVLKQKVAWKILSSEKP